MRYILPILFLLSFLDAKTIEVYKSNVMDESVLKEIYENFIDKKYPQRAKKYKEWIKNTVYRDSSKEVVISRINGLMWQDNSDAKTIEKGWHGAKRYCEELSFAGYSDWRLPNKDELSSIVDRSRRPAVVEGFKNAISEGYWSSTTDASYTSGAWGVFFAYGGQYYNNKSVNLCVRCVRAGEFTVENPYKNISDGDKLSALVDHFMQKEIENIQKPAKTLEIVKGEFESTKEFESRVEEARRAQKEAVDKYKLHVENTIKTYQPTAFQKALETLYGKPEIRELRYDADSGYFLGTLKFEKRDDIKKVAIKVPRDEAREFKKRFSEITPKAVFNIDEKGVAFKEVSLSLGNKRYATMMATGEAEISQMAVTLKNDYRLDDVKSASISISDNSERFDASQLKSYNDLEKLLDSAKKAPEEKSKWLFLVGIEKYDRVDNIAYSTRSAKMFEKVAKKVLGVPERHVYSLYNDDATLSKIKSEFTLMMRKVKKGDTIYFYYNGHGVPAANEKNEPYMLPSDVYLEFVQDDKFFALKNIYHELSNSKASKVIAVVDSCFSGGADGKALLKGVAAPRVKQKRVSFDKEKMVVLSASKDDQYSNGYEQKAHRLFSYFVMKSLLEGERDVKALYNSVYKDVKKTSFEEYGDFRLQEPDIDGNRKFGL